MGGREGLSQGFIDEEPVYRRVNIGFTSLWCEAACDLGYGSRIRVAFEEKNPRLCSVLAVEVLDVRQHELVLEVVTALIEPQLGDLARLEFR